MPTHWNLKFDKFPWDNWKDLIKIKQNSVRIISSNFGWSEFCFNKRKLLNYFWLDRDILDISNEVSNLALPFLIYFVILLLLLSNLLLMSKLKSKQSIKRNCCHDEKTPFKSLLRFRNVLVFIQNVNGKIFKNVYNTFRL